MLFFAWYMYAADYSYRALSGTYVLITGDRRWTLTLRADQSFSEDADTHWGHLKGSGKWRRIGEGGIVFEGEFLTPQGVNRSSTGTVFAEASKSYTLRPSLDFTNGGVRFFKRFF